MESRNLSIVDLGIRKFDRKDRIRETASRVAHRSRNMQREMKEVVRTRPNV
ncbi:MAG: hypothetical protein PVH37_15650 [Desulfobacterales bacterium]